MCTKESICQRWRILLFPPKEIGINFRFSSSMAKLEVTCFLLGARGSKMSVVGTECLASFTDRCLRLQALVRWTSLPLPEPKEDLELSAYLEHQAMRQAFKLSTESHSLTLWLVLPLTVGLVLDPPRFHSSIMWQDNKLHFLKLYIVVFSFVQSQKGLHKYSNSNFKTVVGKDVSRHHVQHPTQGSKHPHIHPHRQTLGPSRFP